MGTSPVGSWANPLYRFLDVFMTGYHAKVIVGVISYIGLIVIAWMLSRVVPWTAAPGLDKDADLRRDPLTIALANRAGAVGRVADHLDVHTLLVRPARLDAASRAGGQQARPDHADRRRCTVAGLRAGRAIDMGPALDFTATRMRDTVSPIVQMAMVLAVILWWRQPDRPELFPFKKPKAPASRSRATDGVSETRLQAPRKASSATQLAAEGGAFARLPVPIKELASRRRS